MPDCASLAGLPAREPANWSLASDNDLVVAFQAGDHRAFDELYKRYNRRFVNYFRKAGIEDAEDLAHDVWYRIISNLSRFDLTRVFRSWAFAICNNAKKNVFRDADPFDSIWDSLTIPSERDDPLARVEAKEIISKAKALLETRLPKAASTVSLVMQGYLYREVAEILRVPLNTVKTRMFAANKLLAQLEV